MNYLGWVQPQAAAPTQIARIASRSRLSNDVGVLIVCQLLLLTLAGARSLGSVNADAISYIRIAEYYAHGRLDLAINGYWGPLISWIMVPALWVGLPTLVVLRIACAISAVVFLLGALRIFRVVGLSRGETAVAGSISMLFAVYWSVAAVSPDLLVSGLLLCGLAKLMTTEPTGTGAHPFRAGLIFGLAYLAKAVGLPIAVGFALALQLLRTIIGVTPWRAAFLALSLTVFGLSIVSLPWIGILSSHYGAPTISTSARINFAIIGPDADFDKRDPMLDEHPSFRIFNVPQVGRITSWEDPSKLYYQNWSPFESVGAMQHLIGHVEENALFMVSELSGFDLIGLGLTSVAIGLLFHWPWKTGFSRETWRLLGVAVLVNTAVYLPVRGLDTRYYLLSYPLLLAASFRLLREIGNLAAPASSLADARRCRALSLIAVVLVVALAIPTTGRRAARAVLAGINVPSLVVAQQLAAALRLLPEGPIASVGTSAEHLPKLGTIPVSDQVGLFAAFLTDRPFYGAPRNLKSVDEILASGASVIVTPGQSPADLALSADDRVKPVSFGPEMNGTQGMPTIHAYKLSHR
jgi:hypothetical protein